MTIIPIIHIIKDVSHVRAFKKTNKIIKIICNSLTVFTVLLFFRCCCYGRLWSYGAGSWKACRTPISTQTGEPAEPSNPGPREPADGCDGADPAKPWQPGEPSELSEPSEPSRPCRPCSPPEPVGAVAGDPNRPNWQGRWRTTTCMVHAVVEGKMAGSAGWQTWQKPKAWAEPRQARAGQILAAHGQRQMPPRRTGWQHCPGLGFLGVLGNESWEWSNDRNDAIGHYRCYWPYWHYWGV